MCYACTPVVFASYGRTFNQFCFVLHGKSSQRVVVGGGLHGVLQSGAVGQSVVGIRDSCQSVGFGRIQWCLE